MQLDDLLGSDPPHATFHDAGIERLALDYIASEAVLDCSIRIGDPDAEDEEAREMRRRGRLIFRGLHYCAIDPPDSSYPYDNPGSLCLSDDGSVGSDSVSGERLPANIPAGSFAHYFFINDWNAFIYIAAENARFEWME